MTRRIKGGGGVGAVVELMMATCCVLVGCGNSAPATRRTGASAAAVADVGAPRQDTTSGRGNVEWYSATQLSLIGDALSRAGSSGRTFGGHPSFHYVESRRDRDGSVEIHDQWVDLTIVQSGRATLVVGGEVTGGALASGGEHRGGTIVGGAARSVAAGDFFVVPAGVPHQFQIAHGDSIRYLTIKVAR